MASIVPPRGMLKTAEKPYVYKYSFDQVIIELNNKASAALATPSKQNLHLAANAFDLIIEIIKVRVKLEQSRDSNDVHRQTAVEEVLEHIFGTANLILDELCMLQPTDSGRQQDSPVVTSGNTTRNEEELHSRTISTTIHHNLEKAPFYSGSVSKRNPIFLALNDTGTWGQSTIVLYNKALTKRMAGGKLNDDAAFQLFEMAYELLIGDESMMFPTRRMLMMQKAILENINDICASFGDSTEARAHLYKEICNIEMQLLLEFPAAANAA